MSDTDLLISIVVPVRNRAGIVTRTLDSIAQQSCREFRLIVVDNASTDTTAEVVNRWIAEHADSGIEMQLLSESRPGASAARNCGLAATTTPYVMFFDSDDEMLPDHLERITDALRNRPDTELLRWDVGVLDSDGWLHVRSPRFHNEQQLNLIHNSLSTQRYAVRTDLLRSAGAWNEHLSTWDDIELGNRLLLSGITVRKLNGEPRVYIHLTAESITGESYTARVDNITRALDTIERTLRDAPEPDADLLNILDARRAITAALLRREGNRQGAKAMMATARNGHRRTDRMKLRLIYTVTRMAGRGGSAVALAIFGKKAEKR